jgi:hypothetical protein
MPIGLVFFSYINWPTIEQSFVYKPLKVGAGLNNTGQYSRMLLYILIIWSLRLYLFWYSVDSPC